MRAGSGIAIRKHIGADCLDASHFVVRQGVELLPAAPLRQTALILANEQDQVLDEAVRHLDGRCNPALRFVMAAQIIDFFGKV